MLGGFSHDIVGVEGAAGPGLPGDFKGNYELFAVVTHKGREADGGEETGEGRGVGPKRQGSRAGRWGWRCTLGVVFTSRFGGA